MTGAGFGGLDGLHVKHASLDAAAQQMCQTAQAMNARLDQLEQEARRYVDTWAHDSEQRTSYDRAKAAWDRAMRELLGLLDGVAKATHQSNADYAGADRRGAGRFDS